MTENANKMTPNLRNAKQMQKLAKKMREACPKKMTKK